MFTRTKKRRWKNKEPQIDELNRRCFRSDQDWCDDQRTARLVKVLQIPSMVIPLYVNPG